jgi:hypothetical protein
MEAVGDLLNRGSLLREPLEPNERGHSDGSTREQNRQQG